MNTDSAVKSNESGDGIKMATTAKTADDIIKATGISESDLIAMFLQASASTPFSLKGDPMGKRTGSFESTFDSALKARKAAGK